MLNKNDIIQNPRVKWLASLLLVLVIGYFVYTQVISRYFANWSAQTIVLEKKHRLLKRHVALVESKDELHEKFASLSQKIQAKLPVEREESQFLSEIGKVAGETNIHIATMNPRPLRDLGSFKELSVEIDLEANLGNLVRFLYQMRRSSVVLVANRLILNPKSERSALLKAHLVISTIFLKEK